MRPVRRKGRRCLVVEDAGTDLVVGTATHRRRRYPGSARAGADDGAADGWGDVLTRAGQAGRGTRRLAEIVAVLARHGLAGWLHDRAPEPVRRHLGGPDAPVSPRTAPERLRIALTELGPTFVKLGQMLSLTPGVLPEAYADELAELQQRVEPEPTDVARATIERELGRTADELYARSGEQPFAAGSLAQVYRAELDDGTVVAVKVQRDGIEARVHEDLELIEYLAGVLEDRSDELALYRPRELAARFRSRMLEELDFEREAANANRFAASFSGEPDVVFPRVYPELSGRRVLTMSLLEGTTFASLTPEVAELIDGKALGERGAEVWLDMVFRDGFVHSDPHPGNLVVMSGSRLGIIDTGMVVRIDDRTREQLLEFIEALVVGSASDLADELLEMCEHPPDVDRGALTGDLDGLVSTYGSRSLRSIDAGQGQRALAAIVHRHRLLLPGGISMLLRVLVALEGTSRLLDADFRIMPLLQGYWRTVVARQWSPQSVERRLASAVRGWRRRGRRLGDSIDVATEVLRRGSFEVQVTHAADDRIAHRFVQGVIAGALLLASAVLWRARAAPVVDGVPIIAAVGLAIGALLALHLLVRIHRSGGV